MFIKENMGKIFEKFVEIYSVNPNNKNPFIFDDLIDHKGFVPYTAIRLAEDKFTYDHELGKNGKTKSYNYMIKPEYLDEWRSEYIDKEELYKDSHNSCQEYMYDIVKDMRNVLIQNKGLYQAELAKYTGLIYHDSNRVVQTLFDTMIKQKIIKKYKKGKNVYFEVISDKEYERIKYQSIFKLNKCQSYLESKIANHCLENDIYFVQQVSFSDCRHKGVLKFDFGLYLNGGFVLCEINGRQHSQFTPFFHKTQQDFINQQIRDEIKVKYCKREGIPLITINYDEDILKSFETSVKKYDFI